MDTTHTPSTDTPAPLPDGYVWAPKSSLTPEEIMALRASVGWDPELPDIWQIILDQPGDIAVARTTDGALIGMARLTPDPRHAVVCDLAVHPNHQRKHIGTTLATELLRLARARLTSEHPIIYLYGKLAANNPLLEEYRRLGFTIDGEHHEGSGASLFYPLKLS